MAEPYFLTVFTPQKSPSFKNKGMIRGGCSLAWRAYTEKWLADQKWNIHEMHFQIFPGREIIGAEHLILWSIT